MSESLTAFSEKYYFVAPDFYSQINFDTIKNLDVIKDVLIIETTTGLFIEKFEIINNLPYPTNYDNNLTIFSDVHKIDYWYDEISNDIITFEIQKINYENDINNFNFKIKNFNILDGEYTSIETFNLYISGKSLSAINALKICYNPDTNLYNLTFTFDLNMSVIFLSNFKDWQLQNAFFICPNNDFKFLLD